MGAAEELHKSQEKSLLPTEEDFHAPPLKYCYESLPPSGGRPGLLLLKPGL